MQIKLQVTMFGKKKTKPVSVDLPKKGEPLNCAFQNRSGTNIYCALSNRTKRPCLIDICPMYQTMKMLRKQHTHKKI